jgi:putative membrane protein
MQTQKDKIAVDISQIPQEILKIYDRWRFFKYLFAGIFMSFIVFLLSLWNVDRMHPYSLFTFGMTLFVSALISLVCLSALRHKRYSVFLLSDESKAFSLISAETTALFLITVSVMALYFQIKSGAGPDGSLMIFTIIMTPVAIIAHNANEEFAADETVYLPQRVLKSQEKISKFVADETTNGQNLSQAQTQDSQAKAAKFEPKIDDASPQDELAQSDEDTEALEYGRALAQIPKNLKRRYQIHLLIRYAFVSFAAMAFLIFSSSDSDKLYWAFIASAVCIVVFFTSGCRYSKLFVENPEKSNAIFAIENFAIMTLVLYYPVGSLFLEGKAVHRDTSALIFVYLYIPLIPILSIITIVCLARNLSFYKEIK